MESIRAALLSFIGDIVNVIGDFIFVHEGSSKIKANISITNTENLLILDPDNLFTATALSNASYCRRRPLLSSLVHAGSDITPSLVWGNIIHFVLQAALVEDRWDEAWMNEKIEEVVRNHLSDLLALDTSVETAIQEVKIKAKGLQSFSKKYISQQPKVNSFVV